MLDLATYTSCMTDFSLLLLPTSRISLLEMTSTEVNLLWNWKEGAEDTILDTSAGACLVTAAALNLEAWIMVTAVKLYLFHPEGVFPNFLAREKIKRRAGLEGLRSKPTLMTTSERRKEAIAWPRTIEGTRKHGKNQGVQPINYPHMYATLACVNQSNAYLTKPQLRDEDEFDRRQSLAAANISKSYQSVAEKRNNHNNDYIGHWPREKRRGHKKGR